MDEREHPSIAVLVIEVATPLFYGFMVASPILLIHGSELPAPLFAAIGLLYGACLIWAVIRWVNRRDDPRHAKRPPDGSSPGPG